MFYRLLKHLLFMMDAEKSHDFSLQCLDIIHRTGITRYFPKPCEAPCKAMGLVFKNPIGLAAGFDKNGDYIDALSSMGFGFMELGTVTPRPQTGNPFPRLFRIPEHGAVINRMGFNNKGVDYLVSKIKASSYAGVIGVNIGKNMATTVDDAHNDYLYCIEKAYPYTDYLTINISSPNTPGLRKLQLQDHLEMLLALIQSTRDQLFQKYHRYVPVVVKIAPDLNDSELFSFVKIFKQFNLDGIIATNTTLSRNGVESSRFCHEQGGLSGQPLQMRASGILNELKKMLHEKTTLIASGGIMTAQDVVERIQIGANLVQLYTGLIYSGPGLVKEASRRISISYSHRLTGDAYGNIKN